MIRFIKTLLVGLLTIAFFLPEDVICRELEHLPEYRARATNVTLGQTLSIPLNIATPDLSTFGGITGLTYDAVRKFYYALSYDIPSTVRSAENPRFYTIQITDSSYDIIGVTNLKSPTGVIYQPGALEPRGISYYDNALYISHGAGTDFAAGIWEYGMDGVKIAEFAIPQSGRSDTFHSVSVTPGGDKLYAASDISRAVDGPNAIRIMEFNRNSRISTAQFVYNATGLVDMVALDDDGSFLTLESDGTLYYSLYRDATNVAGNNNLTKTALDLMDVAFNVTKSTLNLTNTTHNLTNTPLHLTNTTPSLANTTFRFVRKTALASFSSEIQTMAVQLANSRDISQYGFVLMGNNEFNKATVVLTSILHVDTSVSVVLPVDEIGPVSGQGIAQDPAVWVNPVNTHQSLVIGALLDGGLAVYNLTGHLMETTVGEFHSVDLIYAFKMNNGTLIDVVVASRGDGNALSVYRVSFSTPYLTDITSGVISTGGPAHHVATYTSPYTGKSFVFVSRGEDIAQIELEDSGTLAGGSALAIRGSNIVASRVIDVNREVAGMVIDREIGSLYVTLRDGPQIIKLDAEPNERSGDSFQEVASSDVFDSTLGGITMYYSGFRDGYLIVSEKGDSSFSVFERNFDNAYVGSFTISEHAAIDRTDGSHSVDVVNVNLGPDFECGVFFAQDNDNDSNSVTNRNANFKLVPFNTLSDAMSQNLLIDTESWGPRRFALASWVDTLSLAVYSALGDGDVSGRDARYLLDLLAHAAYLLYPPATKKRQMMEPFVFVRHVDGRRNNSGGRRRTQSRCSEQSSTANRSGINSVARDLLISFVNSLAALKRDGRLGGVDLYTFNHWIQLAGSVIQMVPADT